jgi:5-methyltetrahydropteroyltriglutamate--homocysteine methyltransferase
MPQKLLPTALVGSYPQPEWLIDRAVLTKQTPPRTLAQELWRVDPRWLEEAQDDATLIAIRDQERVGLDIVTDGEIRRVSYSNRFANALDGIDHDNPGRSMSRLGTVTAVPRVIGKIARRYPVEVRDVRFLRANTERTIKITVPGPFTMAQQAQNDYYETIDELAFDYAAAVNAEIKDLFAAGADIVQLDEPYLQARPDDSRRYGIAVINRALDGVSGTTALHICFGYALNNRTKAPVYDFLAELEQSHIRQISVETAQSNLDCSTLAPLSKTIILGVIDLADAAVESAKTVAARIRRALPFVPAEQMVIAPDCGMKYLPRALAYGKLRAMVEGAAIVRRELAG